jgi:hypothetical protein
VGRSLELLAGGRGFLGPDVAEGLDLGPLDVGHGGHVGRPALAQADDSDADRVQRGGGEARHVEPLDVILLPALHRRRKLGRGGVGVAGPAPEQVSAGQAEAAEAGKAKVIASGDGHARLLAMRGWEEPSSRAPC